jgi:hypothetical protein
MSKAPTRTFKASGIMVAMHDVQWVFQIKHFTNHILKVKIRQPVQGVEKVTVQPRLAFN